jgi:predicted DNA-binding ribbon-helix-helix protein
MAERTYGRTATCQPARDAEVAGEVVALRPGRPRASPGGESARPDRGGSTLICRNVVVGGHRTSLRLERLMWDALGEICQREGTSRAEICTRVDSRRRESSLTAALRVYILSYFKAAATEEGHADAGHGRLA